MGWAAPYIADLKKGLTVQFRPKGNSMSPLIESGQLCTVVPVTTTPAVGDAVLCKVNGREYLHLVKAVRGNQFQIGNNRGSVNGWITLGNIFGVLAAAED